MFISDRAAEHMEKTAQSVGFGRRDDYPFRGTGAVSSGDWKGASSAACVFADEEQAQDYLDRVLPGLTALGSDVASEIIHVDHEEIGPVGCVAIIKAMDLVHVDDEYDDGDED